MGRDQKSDPFSDSATIAKEESSSFLAPVNRQKRSSYAYIREKVREDGELFEEDEEQDEEEDEEWWPFR